MRIYLYLKYVLFGSKYNRDVCEMIMNSINSRIVGLEGHRINFKDGNYLLFQYYTKDLPKDSWLLGISLYDKKHNELVYAIRPSLQIMVILQEYVLNYG